MPTQRLLALVYLVGAGILAYFAAGPALGAGTLFALLLVYWLLTIPTYGLSNSLALRNLAHPSRDFGKVRLWGTVGWMAAGWLMGAVMVLSGGAGGRGAYEAFAAAAVLSVVFAGFCLTLPNTPPLGRSSVRGLADLLDGLDLLKHRPVALYLTIAFGVSLTTPFIYQTVPSYLREAGMPRAWITSSMTLSQVPEILALAVLPMLHGRFGLRGTLAMGVSAWALQYLVLSTHPPLLLALAVIPLNGIAIAGFVVTGQMFLDSQAPPDRRASAQALYVVVASGSGSLLGNLLAGELVAWCGGLGTAVFLVPGLINVAMVAAVLRLFPATRTTESRPPGAIPGPLVRPGGVALAAAGRLAPKVGPDA